MLRAAAKQVAAKRLGIADVIAPPDQREERLLDQVLDAVGDFVLEEPPHGLEVAIDERATGLSIARLPGREQLAVALHARIVAARESHARR